MTKHIIPQDQRAHIVNWFVDNHATVRKTAENFKCSKTTVHNILREAVEDGHPQVLDLLKYNKAIRHIRGGVTTREKYKGVLKKQ